VTGTGATLSLPVLSHWQWRRDCQHPNARMDDADIPMSDVRPYLGPLLPERV